MTTRFKIHRKMKAEGTRGPETEGERKLRENIDANRKKKEEQERERQNRNKKVKHEYRIK